MASYLSKQQGIYDPGKRYLFRNISNEPYVITWNSRIVKKVAPNEAIEISDSTPYPGSGMGQCLAYKETRNLATKIILGEGTIDAERLGMTVGKSYISPIGTRAGIPEARKPYEQKILQELPADAEFSSILNQQKAEEIKTDQSKQLGVNYSSTPSTFVNAPKSGELSSKQEFAPEIPKAEFPQAPKLEADIAKEAPKRRGRPVKTENPANLS